MSNDIKVQALLEQMGEQTMRYEAKIADLRVALTENEQQKNQLVNRVNELQGRVDSLESQQKPIPPTEDVIEGAVIESEQLPFESDDR